MEEEKINIASLSIDFNDVIKQSAKYSRKIEETKKKQKELDKTTEEGRQAFVKYEAELKNLKKSYRDNQSFASALQVANEDLIKTMSVQNKSTQELRDSRSQLNQISKNIVGNTEEEIALRTELNEAIDAQTEALREQSSEFNSSKDGIGEYEEGFKSAFAEMNIFNGGLSGFVERSQKAGGVGKFFSGSLKAMKTNLIGVTKASLAFIATPFGAALAVIAGIVTLVKNAMNQGGKSVNNLKKGFAAFSGIIKAVLKILKPLGEFFIDGLVKGVEIAEKAIYSIIDSFSGILSFLGFDKLAKSVDKFSDSIKENAKAAKELFEAEKLLEKQRRKAKLIQLEFQKRAEKLRQIRDDEKKSIADRIKANKDLGLVLREQLKEELKIANLALKVANLRIKAEGKTKENLDEQAEALTGIAEIQERITSQESEQLSNLNSLRRDAAAKRKEIADKAIQKMNEELDLYIKQQGIRKLSLQEELEFERKVAAKKISILDAELAAKKISQTKYDSEVLDLKNNLLQKQADLTVENARKELKEYNNNNRSKLDAEKFLSEELFNEEKARFERLAEQRREFAKLQLEEGVISQTEYNAAINEINEENRVLNEELELERKEVKAEQQAIDLENKLIAAQEEYDNEFAVRQSQLENDRQAELAAAEKTGADKTLINKKYNAFEKTLGKDLTEFKNQQNASILGGLKGLFGESTDLGKAFAIAEIATNTVQNASKAFTQAAVFAANPLTLPLAVNANIQGGIIVATGAAQAAKVAGVKFAQGGILDGASHAQGGIQTRFGELEGGEAIINKRSTAMFAPLLSSLNEAGGGRRFAQGGILGQSGQPSSFIDYDMLANKVAEANLSLPAPVVGVDEISSVSNKVNVIEELASL